MKHLLFTLLFLAAFSSKNLAQCSGGEVQVQIDVHTDSYGYEGYWELVSADSACGQGTILSGGNTLVGCGGAGQQNQAPGGYAGDQSYTSMACLLQGNSYRIAYIDDWGDGGFEFVVYINGYPIGTYSGSAGFEYFTFDASEPPAYDLSMLHPHIKPYQQQGNIDIETEIYNGGTQTITSLTLHYAINNGTPQSQQLSGLSIANNATGHIIHPTPWSPVADGVYEVSAWYTDLNGANSDANPADDAVEITVNIGPGIPNMVDSYLLTLPVITEIANSSNLLNMPTDLDFHPILTKKELWVLNKDLENTGSSTVTISNAGESNQSGIWRRDGNAWHFMSLSTGIAFSDENSNFATSPGVYDANHNGGQPFTGPALWSSDPAIYAMPSGGNGSHLDMLHESPECQGIAHETENTFWVFDGYNGDIVRYNFNGDHGPGNDDHSNGEVLRFADVTVEADAQDKVVSHLVYDKETDWLYIVDHGNQRVFRLDTKSGNLGGTPSFGPFEPLQQYSYMTGYDWEVVADSGLQAPAGIDIIDDRLLVSDYATGEVIIYDISQMPATELKRIQTGAEGIMGIKIGPEGKIWYVDYDAETVNRIDWVPDTTVGIAAPSPVPFVRVYPNPSNGNLNVNIPGRNSVDMKVYNSVGVLVTVRQQLTGYNHIRLDIAPGVYLLDFEDPAHKTQREWVIIQ